MLLWAVFLQVSHSLSFQLFLFCVNLFNFGTCVYFSFLISGRFRFFSVAGLIDSMIYHSSRALQKKIDLGKAT